MRRANLPARSPHSLRAAAPCQAPCSIRAGVPEAGGSGARSGDTVTTRAAASAGNDGERPAPGGVGKAAPCRAVALRARRADAWRPCPLPPAGGGPAVTRRPVPASRVKQRLTVAGRATRVGRRTRLAAFWPHSGAQRCSPARINEQHSGRSAGIWAGRQRGCNTLRIRRLGVRVPPSARRSKAIFEALRGLWLAAYSSEVQQQTMSGLLLALAVAAEQVA